MNFATIGTGSGTTTASGASGSIKWKICSGRWIND
jgi:hypothetical protein